MEIGKLYLEFRNNRPAYIALMVNPDVIYNTDYGVGGIEKYDMAELQDNIGVTLMEKYLSLDSDLGITRVELTDLHRILNLNIDKDAEYLVRYADDPEGHEKAGYE